MHLIRASVLLFVASSTAVALQTSTPESTPPEAMAKAMVTGEEPGFQRLGPDDFVDVNCEPDTWTWKDDLVQCSGNPVCVIRSKKAYTNFELVCQWRHLKDAGNSGIFVWSPIESLDRLEGPGYPEGIEVQVLDLGYKAAYEKDGKVADWFTCHGDVFPVGSSTMSPFPPVSPNKRRSFPTAETTRDTGEWNHYYVRAINGEIRLWVNGVEVSGGRNCEPRTGHLCLQSEGSPVEFRGLRLRELP